MVKDQTLRTITVICDYCEPESSAEDLRKIVAPGEDPAETLGAFLAKHGWAFIYLPSTDGVKPLVRSCICLECIKMARNRASK